MFGLFKTSPAKQIAKLEKEYGRLLEQARDIQRNGDVVAASAKTAEAERVRERIEAIEAETAAN